MKIWETKIKKTLVKSRMRCYNNHVMTVYAPEGGVIRGKICEVCQKGAMSGHNVSHSNRKSNRVWLPNTQRVRVTVGGTVRHMNVCTRCLRSGKVERAL